VRRKALQDVANTLCAMLVGWRMSEDMEALAELPDGNLRFDLLAGTVVHDTIGQLNLHVAVELGTWLEHRLKQLEIDRGAIRSAVLNGSFSTDRIKTNRKRIISFDWRCESQVTTDEKPYVGSLVEKHQWHNRLPPNKSLERTREE